MNTNKTVLDLRGCNSPFHRQSPCGNELGSESRLKYEKNQIISYDDMMKIIKMNQKASISSMESSAKEDVSVSKSFLN